MLKYSDFLLKKWGVGVFKIQYLHKKNLIMWLKSFKVVAKCSCSSLLPL